MAESDVASETTDRADYVAAVMQPSTSPLTTRVRTAEKTKAALAAELAEVACRCLEAGVTVEGELEGMLHALLRRKVPPVVEVAEPCQSSDEPWADDDDCGYALVAVSLEEFERLNGGRPPQGRRRSSFLDQDDADPATRRRRTQLAVLASAPKNLRAAVERTAAPGDMLGSFDVRVVFDLLRTGFEETKELQANPGAEIGGRYTVEGLIGHAAFSTTYAASFTRHKQKHFACLKVVKNSKDFLDQSLDEIKLLRYLNDAGDPHANRIVGLLDYFYFREHLVIVTELLGENLFRYAKRRREEGHGFPAHLLRRVASDSLIALRYVHSLGMIHCDVKPENLVLTTTRLTPHDDGPIVKLIDFGSSCFAHDRLSSYVQSRSYRAPEVVLGASYDAAIDVWSLGCVLAEAHTGHVLFQSDSLATMLARVIAVLGPFPPSLLRRATFAHDFFCAGTGDVYDHIDNLWPDGAKPPGCASSDMLLVVPKRTTLHERIALSADAPLVRFLADLLALDPADRPTAEHALAMPYITMPHQNNKKSTSNDDCRSLIGDGTGVCVRATS